MHAGVFQHVSFLDNSERTTQMYRRSYSFSPDKWYDIIPAVMTLILVPILVVGLVMLEAVRSIFSNNAVVLDDHPDEGCIIFSSTGASWWEDENRNWDEIEQAYQQWQKANRGKKEITAFIPLRRSQSYQYGELVLDFKVTYINVSSDP